MPNSVSRWILYLQDFNFTVEHRNGNKMKHVDALSRYPTINLLSIDLMEKLKRAQQADLFIKTIMEVLKFRSYENYKICKEILFKEVNGLDLIVVSEEMQTELIRKVHENGHFAVEKTIHAVENEFHIPDLMRKVQNCLKNCVQCILFNKKLGKKEGKLNIIDKGNQPLHTFHLDHIGPIDVTLKQYKYIFTVVDAFSKFVWMFPIKKTSTDEVLQ